LLWPSRRVQETWIKRARGTKDAHMYDSKVVCVSVVYLEGGRYMYTHGGFGVLAANKLAGLDLRWGSAGRVESRNRGSVSVNRISACRWKVNFEQAQPSLTT